ncbi:hypothetical protein KSF78_0001049 [Schistosoma japonicum]|nr:hypothetical protein KSF78_0001049 [Schistosoma japonicum]
MAANQGDLKGCSFEVYGRVQGIELIKVLNYHQVFVLESMRLISLKQMVLLAGLRILKMELLRVNAKAQVKHWLCNVGSPNSHIDKCQFKNERKISQLHFKGFNIRH